MLAGYRRPRPDALVPFLDGRPTDVEGEQVSAKGWLTIDVEPCPVLLAALGPRMLELVTACVTGDPEDVRAHGRTASELYDSFPSYRRMLDREGVSSGADLTLAGSIDDIVEGLAAYVEAGATDLRIAITARNDDERRATRDALAASLSGGEGAGSGDDHHGQIG